MSDRLRLAAQDAQTALELVQEHGSDECPATIACAIQDLRAALAEPKAEQRKPLTSDAVWASNEIMSLNADLGLTMDTLMRLISAVERAHGIGGGE